MIKTFNTFDTDKSGDLDRRELANAMIFTFRQMNAPCPP